MSVRGPIILEFFSLRSAYIFSGSESGVPWSESMSWPEACGQASRRRGRMSLWPEPLVGRRIFVEER